MSQELEITIDIEIPVTITVDTTKGRPGKYSGPWEDSYPDEPAEAEITGFDKLQLFEDVQKHLDKIPEDELLEYVEDEMQDRHDYAMECKADQIREDRMMGVK